MFQISKKQHELVKNMKQSGKSIQSRSLNRVLGNLDSFHVQPYEVFVEEEQKKLHQHWLVDCEGNMSFLNFSLLFYPSSYFILVYRLQLATKVLPVAFDNWRGRQLQRSLVINSLTQELKDYKKSLMKVYDSALSSLLLFYYWCYAYQCYYVHNNTITITIIIIIIIIHIFSVAI